MQVQNESRNNEGRIRPCIGSNLDPRISYSARKRRPDPRITGGFGVLCALLLIAFVVMVACQSVMLARVEAIGESADRLRTLAEYNHSRLQALEAEVAIHE